MVLTRRRTEPWLEKMAVHLAADTPGRTPDALDLQRALRPAHAFVPTPVRDAGQDDVARSNPSGER